MQLYFFNEENEYIYSAPADIDPLESQLKGETVYMLSANSTFEVPPPFREGFKIKWNGNAWEYEEIPKDPEPEPPTLEEIKQTKIASLKAERDTKEVEPIEYNGNTYDYDDKARERINAAIIALELSGQSIEWTLADNTSTSVTATDLKMVIASIAMRSNALHVAYRNAKEAVEQAETKEEVEAVALEVE